MKKFLEIPKFSNIQISKYFQCGALVCALIISSFSLTAQSTDRSKPPALGPTPSIKVNPMQKFTLSNGLQVVVYEKKEVPIIQLNLVIKAGSVNETSDKLGLAGMTANMMDEGAAGKSSLELSDEIDFLGAEVGASGGLHNSAVTLRSTVSKFDAALKRISFSVPISRQRNWTV
jgi:zinc protease